MCAPAASREPLSKPCKHQSQKLRPGLAQGFLFTCFGSRPLHASLSSIPSKETLLNSPVVPRIHRCGIPCSFMCSCCTTAPAGLPCARRKPSVPSSALIRFVSSALVITVPIYARLFQGRPSVLGRVEYRHVSLWSFSTRYVGTRRLNFSNWYSNIQAPRRSGAVVGGSGEAARNAYCAACPRGAAPGCTCRICPARCDPAACPGGAPARPRRAFRAPSCRTARAGPRARVPPARAGRQRTLTWATEGRSESAGRGAQGRARTQDGGRDVWKETGPDDDAKGSVEKLDAAAGQCKGSLRRQAGRREKRCIDRRNGKARPNRRRRRQDVGAREGEAWTPCCASGRHIFATPAPKEMSRMHFALQDSSLPTGLRSMMRVHLLDAAVVCADSEDWRCGGQTSVHRAARVGFQQHWCLGCARFHPTFGNRCREETRRTEPWHRAAAGRDHDRGNPVRVAFVRVCAHCRLSLLCTYLLVKMGLRALLDGTILLWNLGAAG